MRTSMTLLYKFITTFIAAWLAFALIDQNLMSIILTVAFAGVAFKYMLGDLFIFPTIGNMLASIIDGVLAAVTAYVFDLFSSSFSTSSTGLIIFAALIAISEYFFHIYLLKNEKVTRNEFHREPPME
ncbi:MAG: DUF2512 family protein [Sedimentibacter sp.]